MENADGKPKSDLLTPPQAAKQIGVAHSTIYNAIRDREIEFTRKRSATGVSTTILISPVALAAYVDLLEKTGRRNLGRPKKQEAA